MKLSKLKLHKIQEYFKDQPVNKAYILGSYSRNMAEKNSDVDILVELDYTKKIGLKFVICNMVFKKAC